MAQRQWSELADHAIHASGGSASHPLMTLTYRSRATVPMTPAGLLELQRSAAVRNRAEGVTGIVLYDDQRFFQWIEGPPNAIGRVWSSISRDARHTDIDAISVHSSPTRLFAQWDLKLSLNRQEMPTLLSPAAPVTVDPDAERLATLAIGSDADAARTLLKDAQNRLVSYRAMTEQLIEPAARHLGDLWSDDHCGEYEVALGLCRLQTYMREVNADTTPDVAAHPLVVLVAPLPGEIHMLGATLGAEATWQSGWETHVRFPSTDEALRNIVATDWFDAIDLSLSPAFQRDHRIQHMEQIIHTVRQASRNPALVVVAGGRAFFDRLASSGDVGADAIHASAADVVETIEQVRRGAL